jgi:hypothetical protein
MKNQKIHKNGKNLLNKFFYSFNIFLQSINYYLTLIYQSTDNIDFELYKLMKKKTNCGSF